MAITSRPQDKYAFLFTGAVPAPAIADIQNVFDTLTQYYNYPVANIRVVCGDSAGMTITGATVLPAGTLAALNAELATFAAAASGPASLAGFSKTAVLYFTGGGTPGQLVINDGGATVDVTWLTTQLNLFSNCHVDVVMQQSFAGGFQSALIA